MDGIEGDFEDVLRWTDRYGAGRFATLCSVVEMDLKVCEEGKVSPYVVNLLQVQRCLHTGTAVIVGRREGRPCRPGRDE